MYKFNFDNVIFTSDEHYYHNNIIKYCNRPYSSIEEMNEDLINKHNEIAKDGTVTIHLGDFILTNNPNDIISVINRLNGKHIFLNGSHDRWIKVHWNKIVKKINNKLYTTKTFDILNVKVGNIGITCCHYAMLTWPASHHGTIHLFGHSHGELVNNRKKSLDIGVDCNNYYPFTCNDIFNALNKQKQSIVFFQNVDCRFFPCYKEIDIKNFNCLFCFCPLYPIKDCGGDWTIIDNRFKDCSHCIKPHLKENYYSIIEQIKKYYKR